MPEMRKSALLFLSLTLLSGCAMKEGGEETNTAYIEQEGGEETNINHTEQAEELLEDYIQAEEIPSGWCETDEELTRADLKGAKPDACVAFNGQVLNGLSDIWTEDKMWISKINIRPFFHVWFRGEQAETDYPAWLFTSTLYMTMEEGIDNGNWKYCLDAKSPSFSGYAIPYNALLEEPLVLCSEAKAEEIEPVFRAVYEKMHEIQLSIDGDLSQDIRFGVRFDPWEDYARYLPEEDFSGTEEWVDTMAVEAYYRWEKECGEYFPVHRISFYESYEEGGMELFDDLMKDRELYLASEEEKDREEQAPASDTDGCQEEIYTVEEGDSLWKIAEKIYGDGRRWQELYERNREVIGENPELIYAGTRLVW